MVKKCTVVAGRLWEPQGGRLAPSPTGAPTQGPPSTSSACCSVLWWGFAATHSLLPGPSFVRADHDALLPKSTQLGKRLATRTLVPPVSLFL